MKKLIKRLLSVVSGVVMLACILSAVVCAETPTPLVPSVPKDNANLITGAPTLPDKRLSYAGNVLSNNELGDEKQYYAAYPLDASLTAESDYVMTVDLTNITLNEWVGTSGPIIVFRKNTDGNYLGLWFQKATGASAATPTDVIYLIEFTLSQDQLVVKNVIGNIDNPLPANAGKLTVYSAKDKVAFNVADNSGKLYNLTAEKCQDELGTEHSWEISGGAPAAGLAFHSTTGLATVKVQNIKPDPTQSTKTNESTNTTTTTTKKPTTTMTTRPPVDARPEKVPSHAGCKNLIKNDTAFRTAAEGYSYKDGVLSGTGDPVLGREFGKFDISGIGKNDTYLISAKMTISYHYDEFSGLYFAFRGKDGKDFYAIAFQSNQIYLLNYNSNDYAAGNSATVEGYGDFMLADGKTYQIDIFSTPKKVSVFVDGVLKMDYVTVGETQDPMFGFLSANSNFKVTDLKLYNLSKSTGNAGGSGDTPNTGDSVDFSALALLVMSGVALTAVGLYRRNAVR